MANDISKAVISNRIYMRLSDEDREKVLAALTYRIETRSGGMGPGKSGINVEIIRNYTILSKGVISIPRGRQDLIPAGYEIIDRRVTNEVPFPLARVPLREGQLAVYNEVDSDCFINALVGWGKTFTALHIARKLGQKTLIITHNTMLRDHWIKEVEALFGFTPGVISGSTFDIEDHAIVVGNVQTLTKYALDISKEFGTLIMDEAHHCPADTFTKIIDSSYAKYRIGLSGTMIRKDMRHLLFPDYFGTTVFKPPQAGTLDPLVRILKTGIRLPTGKTWAAKINALLYDPDYVEYVATIAASQIKLGHKVLIIADRVEFLQNVQYHLGDSCVLVTGSTDFETREKVKDQINSGEKTSIAGSRQIFSEGVSVNALSCVILASPIANDSLLEQIVGRVMREFPNKLQPVVIDLQFSDATSKRQNNMRIALYMSKGWEIQSI